MPGFRIANLDGIPPAEGHGLPIDAAWHPVRYHLGVEAFGINAYTSRGAGDVVIEDHDETDLGHQELYFVARGRAEFTLGDETAEAGPGTFVFFADPGLRRKAVALEPDTAIVAVGAKPGETFRPSEWEARQLGG